MRQSQFHWCVMSNLASSAILLDQDLLKFIFHPCYFPKKFYHERVLFLTISAEEKLFFALSVKYGQLGCNKGTWHLTDKKVEPLFKWVKWVWVGGNQISQKIKLTFLIIAFFCPTSLMVGIQLLCWLAKKRKKRKERNIYYAKCSLLSLCWHYVYNNSTIFTFNNFFFFSNGFPVEWVIFLLYLHRKHLELGSKVCFWFCFLIFLRNNHPYELRQ